MISSAGSGMICAKWFGNSREILMDLKLINFVSNKSLIASLTRQAVAFLA